MLEKAVAEMPDAFEPWHNLGRASAAAGNRVRARQAFERALAFGGRNETAEAWLRLEQEAENWAGALPLARRLAEDRQGSGPSWFRLAAVELNLFHLQEALAAADRAIACSPEDANGWYNRGLARHYLNDFAGAAADYAKALQLRSDWPEAASNVVRALTDAGRWKEAMVAFENAQKLSRWAEELPGNGANLLLACCEWEKLDQLARVLEAQGRSLLDRVSPFTALALAGEPALQQKLARAYAARIRQGDELRAITNGLGKGRPIRVGYLSADFHSHATAFLAVDLFECHDRNRFTTFAYSTGPDDHSPMRERLRQALEIFRDLQGRSPEEIAEVIKGDGIDVLVDLKGYTFRGLPQVLALRPAPVQVSFLGYPGTLGAPWIDYLIADSVVIPPEMEQYYDERVVRLPHCYQPNDRQRPREPYGSRSDHNLPAEGMVYCCYNQSYKITASVFRSWLEILKQVPGSVLWLLDQNPLARANLMAGAELAGVDPGRLVFAPPLPQAEHLGRMPHADLFLDTLPYNAHTTASDALWVGVPILTVAGRGFAARVAASLLCAVGLPELICRDHGEYRKLAIELGRNPERLRALKEYLRAGRSSFPLFDTPGYCRNLEAAFEAMLS